MEDALTKYKRLDPVNHQYFVDYLRYLQLPEHPGNDDHNETVEDLWVSDLVGLPRRENGPTRRIWKTFTYPRRKERSPDHRVWRSSRAHPVLPMVTPGP